MKKTLLPLYEHAAPRAPRGAPPPRREGEPRAELPPRRGRGGVEDDGAGQRRAERLRGARDEDEAARGGHGLEQQPAGEEGPVPEPGRRRRHRWRGQVLPAGGRG